MSRLALHLLGPPHIERDGAPITIRRRKAVALLAYLVVARLRLGGRSHSRDTLATLLWPEADQSQARAGLRRALAALKKALGEGWLDADRETVDLNPEAKVWLDVSEFHDRLAECRTHGHPPDQDCPACLPLLAEAAALYRDDFLAGFTLRDSPAFDEWQFFQAQGLRNDLAGALERLAHGHSVQGQFEQAIPYARRWLTLDPLHEPAHRCLMQLYAQSGQRAAALRQYAECERILQEELGVPPQEETTQLFQAAKEGRERAAEDSRPERYRFERKLSSKGSFGTVWLATDTRLDRPVAVKCPKVAHDPAQREQFVAEARMLARLNHPNITQIYDALFDETEDRFYLVTEYVAGKDLSEIIRAGTPLPLDWVLDVAMGILRALSYAHGQGLVHRDVKPDNVMVADDVKLTDFGLADLKSILQRGSRYMAGTPAYMAPEQIEGRAVDGRTDLYALGVMLFEMITLGHLPFDYTDEDEMLEAHLHAAPPPVSQFAPTVPPALEQVITRLLAKDPEDRYPSAEAVMEVLSAIPVEPKLSNLPVSLTPFIGREAELAEIADHLQDPACRLLTLVGRGGIGKTRLAVKAAEAQLDRYPHGVYFVSLAPLQSAEAIVPTIAEALDLSFHKEGEPRQQLLDYVCQKTMLLILDNVEHLLDGVGLVTEILKAAPGVKILTTSRTRLYVQGEYLFPVVGMEFPADSGFFRETVQDAAQYSAVKLFLSSARRARPGFELTAGNVTDVVRICRLVQGMPLGILLAAPWVAMLTPAEIAAQISGQKSGGIGQDLDFLETDLCDVPERQRSIRAVFDHSWNLLTAQERAVMRALSVFRGGFTHQAARQVTGASLRELMALVTKSLVDRTSTPLTEFVPSRVKGLRTGGRYDVPELLRWYAAEKLETLGEAHAARDAHSAYYAEFLHQREADLKGRRQLRALDEIEADFENVRLAWAWMMGKRDYVAINRALESLSLFCMYRSRNPEGRELFRQAREQLAPGPGDEPHPVWGRILVQEFYLSPHEVDRMQVERGLAIAQKHGDRAEIAACLHALGEVASSAADHAKAVSYYEASLAHYRELDDGFNMAAALYKLAQTYRLLGQPEEAIKCARQSLDLSREIGDRFWAASSLANTGVIAFFTGSYSEAETYVREANAIYRELGYRTGIASSNVDLGKLAFLRGDFDKAKTLYQEALAIATDTGNKQIVQSRSWLSLQYVLDKLQGQEVDRYLSRDIHLAEKEPISIPDIPTTIDRFKVKELLGRGPLSAVYRAHDPDRGYDVALKVMSKESLGKYGRSVKKVKHRAEMMVKLIQHPAAAECYGYGETAEHVYVVMELIEGKALYHILEQEGFPPEKAVIGWVVQMCDVLAHMHNQRPAPIIHCDIKPGNVMVDHHGRARLIDVFAAEPYQAGRERTADGTEGYASPEQYFGYSDARSDVYSLGATLHHLLTRRDPHKEMPFSFHEALPRSLNPAISEELEVVILKAVEHHPQDRYQSIDELKTALTELLVELEEEQVSQAVVRQRLSKPGGLEEEDVASPRQIIANRFEIMAGDRLGGGETGDVYRGTDTQTGQTVAIKALKAEIMANQPDMVARFVREGEALRQLNHPNIVNVVAAVEEEGQHYLVIEYVEGGSLRALLEAQGPLSIRHAVEITLELADALARTHHLGIIHRDLKPANVLLAKDGTPRLTDFGHAHVAASPRLTRTGALMGSVGYLSPEVCNGETPDNRADIWALGVMVYEMLTGELPFVGETLVAALNAILTQPVPDLVSLRPDAPDALVALVYRMLEKDRHQRISSMRLVGAELEAILAEERKG